jgi:hypothetical protein
MKELFLRFLDWLFAPPEIDVEDCPLFMDEKGKPYFKW